MPEDFFGDLPDETKEEKPGGKPVEKTEEEKKKEEGDIKQLKIAKKIEDRKYEKAKAELAEARARRRKLQLETEEDDVPPEEDDEEKPQTVDVEAVVAKQLKEREQLERKGRIAALIKKASKSRQEAELAFAQLDKFETTGSDTLDAQFAMQRANAMRTPSGFSTPSFSGADFSDMETRQTTTVGGVSKESKEWLNSQGVTDEDIERIKSGKTLENVFPKVIHSPLNRS